MNARRLALEVLAHVEERGGYASLLLDAKLRAARLPDQERALATELTYGVLRWQGYLDHLLAGIAARPWAALHPAVRRLLRLGAYQLLFLSRVPAFAAINETVSLAATLGPQSHRGVKAFVNAVLRELQRRRDTLHLPDASRDPVKALAVRWSHPEWMVERWLARLGREEAEALLRANNETPTLSVVVNRLKAAPDEVERLLTGVSESVTPGRFVPGLFRLRDGAGALHHGAFRHGWYFPIDEAAALPVLLLGPRPGETILDACVGGGGKAALLLGMIRGDGRVIGLDVNARAHRRLREARHRLGLDRLVAVRADARRAHRLFTRPMDRVLVDAPCSGLGTLRRHPERKWQQEKTGLEQLARFQRELLQGVAPLVKPGGVLVYSTCSLEPEETDHVVSAFLGESRGFQLDDARHVLPANARELVGEDGALRTWPHRQVMDGFFAIRLRRSAA
jgi:16S rRNA (cytosine967-C5)-methyltransferase